MKIRTHRTSRKASGEQRYASSGKETRWFHTTHVTAFIFPVKQLFFEKLFVKETCEFTTLLYAAAHVGARQNYEITPFHHRKGGR